MSHSIGKCEYMIFFLLKSLVCFYPQVPQVPQILLEYSRFHLLTFYFEYAKSNRLAVIYVYGILHVSIPFLALTCFYVDYKIENFPV